MSRTAGSPAAPFRTLLVDERPGRLLVRLNRPEVRNAIDQTMVDELHRVCGLLEHEPRVLILTGTAADAEAKGRSGVFASGADIAELRERRLEDALKGINTRLFLRIAELPMPVIAALDGYVLGGGAELAYAADFRIGTEAVRIGNPEASLGIIAAAGACWRLPELVGEPLAKEILLAGRILDGREALAARLLSSLHTPEQLLPAAEELADRILAQDPLAVQFTKSVMQAPRTEHPRADLEAQAVLFESEAKFARMDAFLAKRRQKTQGTADEDGGRDGSSSS
ncbi:enoyl-CoA hydratase/isomerase family protein [Acaricomes phytoseiuli]|uniref:enoyl-CoA hydratase/isomerase family protein n=1 Tax=Acaricomes phytoseiuli TaxID=291968 RepID=UPI000371272B|nr:enoyl-CoA hydratase/isomerase family protein [Acaricomes phytoseiuli]MCW1250520.1 enoyl-CoA hydratase/isomerase family protein [Acaricomes phytoseiuli]